jgi:hypothetical protein
LAGAIEAQARSGVSVRQLLAESAEERRREITAQELGAILSGIDLSQAQRRKRYQRSG